MTKHKNIRKGNNPAVPPSPSAAPSPVTPAEPPPAWWKTADGLLDLLDSLPIDQQQRFHLALLKRWEKTGFRLQHVIVEHLREIQKQARGVRDGMQQLELQSDSLRAWVEAWGRQMQLEAMKRTPEDVEEDERIRKRHDDDGKSYEWIAREEARTYDAIRAAVRRARTRRNQEKNT
jgi:hypothetical protein